MKTFFLAGALGIVAALSALAREPGVPVSYELPADGPVPKTYLVTLAIVDAKNPDWIVSTFVSGEPRTVTAENKGKFTETWNGLDENLMPVPPGSYGVKGIYAEAHQWAVDGNWHAVTPKFDGGVSAWMPPEEQWKSGEPFGGDPVGSPLRDVAVGPNGVAVFYYQYLENGKNNPMIDLNKELGIQEFLRAFPSGGAAGGTSVATDGETVWAFSADGGPKYVYRADGKSFGSSPGANRANSYLPEGWVTAMAAWKAPQGGKSYVAVAQRGRIDASEGKPPKKKPRYTESATDFVNKITIHDGGNGEIKATLSLPKPQGLAVLGDSLYALHADGAGFAVSAMKLQDGLPIGDWKKVFQVPSDIAPFDLEVDSHGRFYLSDTAANKVFQLNRGGKVLRTFGRLAVQKPGTYDPETLMSPGKLATWKDAQGRDRLLIVENAGPNRTSEWSADDGKLLRDFASLQTKANDGYAVDPEHPEDVYLPGQEHWLTRFKVDYDKHSWTVDAVWPNVGGEAQFPDLQKPRLIRAHGSLFLAGGRSYSVYRLDGDRWVLSAGLLRRDKQIFAWHDANGNGKVDDEELAPLDGPQRVFSYHGQNWLPDLSLAAIEIGGDSVWRLAPDGFDAHGNPIFTKWQKLLTDPVFVARAAGQADAAHGGNELAESYSSDWALVDGTMEKGFYVQARGGKGFNANEGAQYKVSRYVPDGKGGYALQWRVGRAALQGPAKPGEMYGAMRIAAPINGLVSVIDQSRCGVLLYTEDGLYVDTLFADSRVLPKDLSGLYSQPGEFFAGNIYPDKDNGKIYVALGKFTPLLFEAEGWSLRENPARPITTLPKSVMLTAAETATPPEIALSLRGGAGKANVARFAPAVGGAALDGSMTGWENCEPVIFGADRQVEVRCLYDPGHLYLRWHARLGVPFQLKPAPPLERMFTHDQTADTLSFYIQGDTAAPAGGNNLVGRPGDVRFVFGLFQDGKEAKAVGAGFYPSWPGQGHPQTYRTIVRETSFANVGAVPDLKLGSAIDPDGQGFVVAVAIPRSAIPALRQPFGSDLKTLVNFEATFGGHNKFWWANSDGTASQETYDEPSEARLYPGSWAPALFKGLEDGLPVRNWLVCGPFGGPEAAKFQTDPRPEKQKNEVRSFYDRAAYPPDTQPVDFHATYDGDMISGYWPDPRQVKWKPATIEDLDTRVILGKGAQVWYGATWIYSPNGEDIGFELQGHRMTYLTWYLNGQKLDPGPYTKTTQPVSTLNVSLKPGWNEVMFRGYCVGYSPFRAGLVLRGPPDSLWPLRLSGNPPAQ